MGRCLSLLAAMIASISCKFPNPLPTAFVQPGAGFQGLGSHDVGAHVSLYGGAKIAHAKSMMKLRGGLGDEKIPGEEKLQEEEEEEEEEEERLDGVGPWWTTSAGVKLLDDADELYDTASMIMQSVDDGSRYLEEELGIERKRRMNSTQIEESRANAASTCKELLERVLVLDPSHSYAMHLLADLSQHSQPDRAMSLLRQAHQLFPGEGDALIDLGQMCERHGEREEAWGHYTAAQKLRPSDVELACNRGVLARALGRVDDAEGCYLDALKVDPNSVGALSNYGVLAEAEHADYSLAEQLYRRALEIDPDSASPAANLARLLCNKDANSPSENRNESVQNRVESERLVRAALENRPDDPAMLVSAGVNAAKVSNDTARAEECFCKALDSHPQYIPAIHNLAMLPSLLDKHGATERVKASIEDHDLPEEGPEAAALVAAVSAFLLSHSSARDAEGVFHGPLGDRPWDTDLGREFANILARTRGVEERGGAAELAFQGVLDIDPTDARALGDYAALLHRAGGSRRREAEGHYKAAVALAPSDALLWRNWAVLAREDGKVDEAQEMLDRAERLRPGVSALEGF